MDKFHGGVQFKYEGVHCSAWLADLLELELDSVHHEVGQNELASHPAASHLPLTLCLLADTPKLSDRQRAGPNTTPTRRIEPLELRVWVYRERKHTVGQRRSTWTRSAKSRANHVTGDPTWEETPGSFWTPVSRDEAAERRFLAEIARDLGLPAAP